MFINKIKRWLALGLATAIAFIAPLSSILPSQAATTPDVNGANGYQVSPLVNNLTVARGTTKTVNIYVQNVSNAVEYVQTIIDDFTANPNGSGFPAIYLNGESNPTHGLKQFSVAAQPNFTLQPKQIMTEPINITVPAYAASGGYYGAVRFAPQGINPNKNINVAASVAALILITVPGNLKESVNVVTFGAADMQGRTHLFFSTNKNIEALVRFENTGNVQLIPYGNIVLKKGKKELGIFPVNVKSGNVLPGTDRIFTAKLNSIGSVGKFSLVGSFAYNNTGQLVTAKATFYVVPNWLIILAIVLVVIVVVALILLIRRFYGRPSKPQPTI